MQLCNEPFNLLSYPIENFLNNVRTCIAFISKLDLSLSEPLYFMRKWNRKLMRNPLKIKLFEYKDLVLTRHIFPASLIRENLFRPILHLEILCSVEWKESGKHLLKCQKIIEDEIQIMVWVEETFLIVPSRTPNSSIHALIKKKNYFYYAENIILYFKVKNIIASRLGLRASRQIVC